MHKKLKKYIERYDTIIDGISYELIPNGGMIVLMNQETNAVVTIEDTDYALESFQSMLINAYETPVSIQSTEKLNLIAIRFKGAGASFFYETYMDTLMRTPKVPIALGKNILEDELDSYLLSLMSASQLPFNIMKIIDLLDEQGSTYSIDEVLAIANVPRKRLDKIFNLRTGLTFKTYAMIRELSR